MVPYFSTFLYITCINYFDSNVISDYLTAIMGAERTIENLLLDGGVLCLDFTNTVHSRRESPVFDYLQSFEDWIKWLRKVKALSPLRLNELQSYARKHKSQAAEALKEVKEIRETIYLLFFSVAADKPVESEVLSSFNVLLSEALSNIRIRVQEHEVHIEWNRRELHLNEPLWVIVKSGYDVLIDTPFKRIRSCEACGWLFLDQSKNNSRRWCNMQTCGSIHKARKYYHRKKKRKNSQKSSEN